MLDSLNAWHAAGFTLNRLRILYVLHLGPERPVNLSRGLGIAKNDVTNTLTWLEERGYAKRSRVGLQGTLASITPEGESLIA